jgi:excisionase family DNA binding protein
LYERLSASLASELTAPNPGATAMLLTQQEAAERLRLSERTLERWRVSGDGPPFVKAGRRVLYHPDDLAAWIATHTVQSTSEEVGP